MRVYRSGGYHINNKIKCCCLFIAYKREMLSYLQILSTIEAEPSLNSISVRPTV